MQEDANRFLLHETASVKLVLTNRMEQSLLETLTVTQLVKKFPSFYATRTFNPVFTRARHWSLY